MSESPLVSSGLVLYTLQNGLEVQIAPLTIFGQQVLKSRAEEQYPLPDPKPYEVEIPDALVPGTVVPATENPDYVALLREVIARRIFHARLLMLDACVFSPKLVELIELYRPYLDRLGEDACIWLADLGDKSYRVAIESDLTRLLYFWVSNPNEVSKLLQIIQRHLPLEDTEIINSFRAFRVVDIQRDDGATTDSA